MEKNKIEDFDAAFNDADAGKVIDEPGTEQETEQETDTQANAEPKIDDEATTEQETDESTEEQSDNSGQPEPDEKPEGEPGMPDFQQLYLEERQQREAAEQRYRSFEGRYKKEKATTIKALKDEVKELKSQIEQMQIHGGNGAGDSEEDIEALLEDLPGLDKLIEQRAKEIVAQTMGGGNGNNNQPDGNENTQPVQPEVDPAAEHMATIRAAHPDLDSILSSGSLENWIGSLEPAYRTFYTDVYQRGTAQQIIDMLTLFKSQTKQDKAPKAPPQKEHSKPSTAVRSRPAAPRMSDHLGNPDDFDAGWNINTG